MRRKERSKPRVSFLLGSLVVGGEAPKKEESKMAMAGSGIVSGGQNNPKYYASNA